MGVPVFVRWILSQFGQQLLSSTKETPHIDNFYIDLNGVIHPCTHGSNPRCQTEEEMIENVLRYIDRLMTLIKPKKVLYLAIDGVAPRVKMNQQRTRRFHSAKESESFLNIYNHYKDCLGEQMEESETDTWDRNVITPGTEFMVRISDAFRFFIVRNLTENPLWKDLKVVFSDWTAPGEGEHKIFSYIRKLRQDPKYNPDTVHGIHGLDADLAMLSLESHEKYIYLVREENKPSSNPNIFKRPIEIMDIPQLRARILSEFVEIRETPQFRFNPDNTISDFVFLCFFCGNDFIPRIPTVFMDANSLLILMQKYYLLLPEIGYITNKNTINFKALSRLLQELQVKESQDFKTVTSRLNMKVLTPEAIPTPKKLFKTDAKYQKPNFFSNLKKRHEHNMSCDPPKNRVYPPELFTESSWETKKAIFYSTKFGIPLEQLKDHVQLLCMEYFRILAFVWKYYSYGLPSWKHFYPYHYAPFFSDLAQIDPSLLEHAGDFELGQPFTPLVQLLSVLPKNSLKNANLPECYISMAEEHPEWFPVDFLIDLNAETKSFKAVCELPFVDDVKLLRITRELNKKLTPSEHKRNTFGSDLLFFRRDIKEPKLHSVKAKVVEKDRPRIKEGLLNMDVAKDHFFRSQDGNFCGVIYALAEDYVHFDSQELGKSPLASYPDVSNRDVECYAFITPPFKTTKFGAETPGLPILKQEVHENQQTGSVNSKSLRGQRYDNHTAQAPKMSKHKQQPKMSKHKQPKQPQKRKHTGNEEFMPKKQKTYK